MMIDAVQAAHFIPREQTEELVERIAKLANKSQSEDLRRNLFVSKLKDNDKNTLTMADWLNTAINQNKQVTFQYYGYDREGKNPCVLMATDTNSAPTPWFGIWTAIS